MPLLRRKPTLLMRQLASRQAILDAARGWAGLLGAGVGRHVAGDTATNRNGEPVDVVAVVVVLPAGEGPDAAAVLAAYADTLTRPDA